MIAARHTRRVAHSLLDDAPVARRREEERVMIELITVLDGGAVDFGRHPARVDERGAVAPRMLADLGDLRRRSPRRAPLAAGCKETELAVDAAQSLLHRAADGRCHSARVPIEAEHAAERLKPEGIGE